MGKVGGGWGGRGGALAKAAAGGGGWARESVVVVAQLIESYSSVRRTKHRDGRSRGVPERARRGGGVGGRGRGCQPGACLPSWENQNKYLIKICIERCQNTQISWQRPPPTQLVISSTACTTACPTVCSTACPTACLTVCSAASSTDPPRQRLLIKRIYCRPLSWHFHVSSSFTLCFFFLLCIFGTLSKHTHTHTRGIPLLHLHQPPTPMPKQWKAFSSSVTSKSSAITN